VGVALLQRGWGLAGEGGGDCEAWGGTGGVKRRCQLEAEQSHSRPGAEWPLRSSPDIARPQHGWRLRHQDRALDIARLQAGRERPVGHGTN
jgi:hypothetical protein